MKIIQILIAILPFMLFSGESLALQKVHEQYKTSEKAQAWFHGKKGLALDLATTGGKNNVQKACRKKGYSGADQLRVIPLSQQCSRRGSGYRCEVVVEGICYKWQ